MLRFLLFFYLAPLSAEYLRIEQGFGGMDCASCSEFVKGKLAKNPGVQSVEVDAKKGLVVIALKPGNSVKLRQIRDFVQQSGYKLKDTKVTVRGTPWVDRGLSTLKISEADTIRVRDMDAKLREFYSKKVDIEGNVETVTSDGAKLDVLIPTKAELAK